MKHASPTQAGTLAQAVQERHTVTAQGLPCSHKQLQASGSHAQAATLTEAAALYEAKICAHLLFLKLKNFISGHTVLNSTGSVPVRWLSA